MKKVVRHWMPIGLSVVFLLVSCSRPGEEPAAKAEAPPSPSILIENEDALDFSDFLCSVGVLCRETPVLFRHPELAAEIEFHSPGSAACGITIQVRENEVAMDKDVVSLSELEAKFRAYAETGRVAGSIPLLLIDSNIGVAFARGLEVLKKLSSAGIVVVEVSDSASDWKARERTLLEAFWQAKPVNPGG